MEPRILERREEVRRRRRRVWWRGLWTLVVVSVLALAAVTLLHSSLFSARHIVVRGALHTTAAQLEFAAGVEHHPPLIDVSPGFASAMIERLPWVAQASVVRDWPDTLRITISERMPVAAVPGAGRTALVDASGRVLTWVAAAPSGIVVLESPASAKAPGSFLGPEATPGLRVVSNLPPVLQGRVKAVIVDPSGSVTLDLGNGVSALLGPPTGLTAKFESLASVLAGAPPSGPSVIDVTVPGEPQVGPAPAR